MASTAVLDLVVSLKDEASAGLSSIGSAVGGLGTLAGIGAGAAVAGIGAIGATAWSVASDVQGASNQMTAALGLSEQGAANFEGVMKDIYANNFGAGFEDIGNSLVSVEQAMGRLGGTQGVGELQQLTENALALRDVFGVEVSESTNAAATLMQDFGLTGQQAMDFISKGMQEGLNASGDFLDTIGEYSVQFREGGADADDFFSIMESGMQGGMLGTDKAGDAFKEFRVRIQDGSDATYEALQRIGISADDLSDRMGDGTTTAAEAWQEVQTALLAVDDQNIRMQAGVALMGTQYEDLGEDVVLAMSMAGTSLADMEGATDALNVKYNDLGSAMEGAWRAVQLGLEPIGVELLNLANMVMPHVQQGAAWLGEQLPGWIQTAKDAISALTQAFGTGGLQGVLALVLPYVQQVFGSLIEWIVGQLPAWIATLQSWGRAAWMWLQEAIPPLLEQAGAAFLGLLIWVQAQLPGWLETLGQWATEAVRWLADAIPPLLLAAADFLTALLTWANTQVLPRLIDIAGQMAEALYSWVTEILIPEIGPKLLDFMWEMDQKIRNEIMPQIRGAAEQVGRAIISGISGMVSAGAAGLADIVRNAINGAINAAKEALGIQSPSKVFADFGMQAMAGLAEGITDNALLPMRATVDAISGMAGAATLSPVISGGAFGGSGLTINLNGATIRSEDDIDELAYRIQSVLQRRA